jgi:hypothetical protein
MRRQLFLRALTPALALVVVTLQPCAAATPDFSPQAVFALPDRTNIDDRCKDARAFSDKAAQGTDSISADDAIAAANQFAACYRMPKLNPDVDRQRYLVLAGAASLYLAATKTTGDQSIALYKKADSIATMLGGAPPDHSNGIHAIANDPTRASGSPEDQLSNAIDAGAKFQVANTTYNDQRNPHGEGQKQKFTEIATQLRASADAHLNPPASAPAAPHPSSSP